ncbi:hypothetical protein ABER99_20520 [Paenibacillus glucanolyticus]|uniref:Uncharacterized protein n=1 Tax=Paenibacillus glucanolyticus TaxID=59843 RepID=A0A163GGL7_9BACL|nr:hypothetical protein [Paenibacillus glucanolyticus]KZS44961.1 hypothetical protein AWU65_02995 [Paenibacillus glucanolyticus]OMF64821.1 hypothetical protein BK142_31340 [Paenibacillus glucanolyticus]
MEGQLSFIVEDNSLLITDKEVVTCHDKFKDMELFIEQPDPFIEASKKFFFIEEGEQIELDELILPIIEEEKESMSFQEIVKILKDSSKYTILMFDDLTGFPISIQITLSKAAIASFAQYPEALYLDYRVKRRRTNSQFVFLPNKSFIIWDGHIDVDTNMWGKWTRPSVASINVRRSKYNKLDKQYLVDGVNSTEQQPIIEYLPMNAIA